MENNKKFEDKRREHGKAFMNFFNFDHCVLLLSFLKRFVYVVFNRLLIFFLDGKIGSRSLT